MFNSAFDALTHKTPDLYPAAFRSEIYELNNQMYTAFNNGVYRAGFAQSQQAYEEAISDVFGFLDVLENRINNKQFLFGEHLTESDIRAFVTLIRFDAAYFGLFKCNIRQIKDYPILSAYMDRILAISGIKETVNIDHIKHGYYSIKALNPTGIIPVGP